MKCARRHKTGRSTTSPRQQRSPVSLDSGSPERRSCVARVRPRFDDRQLGAKLAAITAPAARRSLFSLGNPQMGDESTSRLHRCSRRVCGGLDAAEPTTRGPLRAEPPRTGSAQETRAYAGSLRADDRPEVPLAVDFLRKVAVGVTWGGRPYCLWTTGTWKPARSAPWGLGLRRPYPFCPCGSKPRRVGRTAYPQKGEMHAIHAPPHRAVACSSRLFERTPLGPIAARIRALAMSLAATFARNAPDRRSPAVRKARASRPASAAGLSGPAATMRRASLLTVALSPQSAQRRSPGARPPHKEDTSKTRNLLCARA
jgi:hypothetical protein